ncbi:MAG: hypothetical protein FWF76_03355 [Oscillospiraceae bacterium]|nr:hypothetical protein [Oscillospiraceae bacterium]
MSKKQTQKSLSPEELLGLPNSLPAVAHDTVELNNATKTKANISSQNADTGLASYNADDTRPYEQKNLSAGFHKSGMGSK